MSPVIIMRNFAKILGATFSIATLLTTTVFAQVPTLKVVTPSEGQTLYGDRLPVLFSVENFQLVDYQTYPNPTAGQGHMHLWLDDQNPTRESAVMLADDNFTYSDVASGNHTLRADLVNNNHTSLIPPVVNTVNFKTAAVATPLPAAVSGFDKNTALVILIVVALVIIAAWWYTKEEETKPAQKTSVRARKASRRRRKK